MVLVLREGKEGREGIEGGGDVLFLCMQCI